MRIRSIALGSFSEKRIRVGAPLATLEETLVLAYLFHRYQVEAAASVLGGLYYNHKLRGDVQKNQGIVSGPEQRRALEVLLKTIQPEFLAINERILNLIPPRPPGYRETRELFPGYTGQTFDPFGAAETAANLTIGLVLRPERAARLVEYHSRRKDIPGLAEVLDSLILSTFKSSPKSGYFAEIQRVVNNVLLYHMMGLAADEEVNPQVRALALLKLDKLKNWLIQQASSKSVKDESQRAHYFYAFSQIKLFQTDPSQVKRAVPFRPPQGAPIGMYD